ncbi:CC0125/CC1285 family lipoprotein [Maritalea mediterranea]|uniref:Uncharacterized protein n=1 Tax=Maritalea mediterranea TaxID=2909667 RepID=A0ABS9E5Q1_9HYPH|nr:hypothetical protein [Maritalea mediterranea]MCF4098194.1 hypothetical protein [Maritalea mediterranea]
MRLIFALISAAILFGCETTSSAIPLQKNVWQVSTSGIGAIAVSKVEDDLMRKVAHLTIEQGYDKFILTRPQSAQGSRYGGTTPVYANTNVNVYGNTGYATTTYSGGQPILIAEKTNSVIVVMYNKGEQGSQNALDARLILAQLDTKENR